MPSTPEEDNKAFVQSIIDTLNVDPKATGVYSYLQAGYALGSTIYNSSAISGVWDKYWNGKSIYELLPETVDKLIDGGLLEEINKKENNLAKQNLLTRIDEYINTNDLKPSYVKNFLTKDLLSAVLESSSANKDDLKQIIHYFIDNVQDKQPITAILPQILKILSNDNLSAALKDTLTKENLNIVKDELIQDAIKDIISKEVPYFKGALDELPQLLPELNQISAIETKTKEGINELKQKLLEKFTKESKVADNVISKIENIKTAYDSYFGLLLQKVGDESKDILLNKILNHLLKSDELRGALPDLVKLGLEFSAIAEYGENKKIKLVELANKAIDFLNLNEKEKIFEIICDNQELRTKILEFLPKNEEGALKKVVEDILANKILLNTILSKTKETKNFTVEIINSFYLPASDEKEAKTNQKNYNETLTELLTEKDVTEEIVKLLTPDFIEKAIELPPLQGADWLPLVNNLFKYKEDFRKLLGEIQNEPIFKETLPELIKLIYSDPDPANIKEYQDQLKVVVNSLAKLAVKPEIVKSIVPLLSDELVKDIFNLKSVSPEVKVYTDLVADLTAGNNKQKFQELAKVLLSDSQPDKFTDYIRDLMNSVYCPSEDKMEEVSKKSTISLLNLLEKPGLIENFMPLIDERFVKNIMNLSIFKVSDQKDADEQADKFLEKIISSLRDPKTETIIDNLLKTKPYRTDKDFKKSWEFLKKILKETNSQEQKKSLLKQKKSLKKIIDEIEKSKKNKVLAKVEENDILNSVADIIKGLSDQRIKNISKTVNQEQIANAINVFIDHPQPTYHAKLLKTASVDGNDIVNIIKGSLTKNSLNAIADCIKKPGIANYIKAFWYNENKMLLIRKSIGLIVSYIANKNHDKKEEILGRIGSTRVSSQKRDWNMNY